jgi:hypothetical protein
VSKAAATDILDAVKLFSIIMAPKTARAVGPLLALHLHQLTAV